MLVTVSRLFLSMFSFLWLKNDWTTKTTFSQFFDMSNFLSSWQKSVFHAFHCFARCTNLLLLLCSSACSTMHVDSFCRHFSHHQQKKHLLQIYPWAARQRLCFLWSLFPSWLTVRYECPQLSLSTINHYHSSRNQQSRTEVLFYYSMLMYSKRALAWTTLISSR